MNKEEMIRQLVSHSVKTALSESKHYWLNELFEKGFAGYRNLSRGQLQAELQMRGLAQPEAETPEDDIDELDMDDYDDSRLDLPLRAGQAE